MKTSANDQVAFSSSNNPFNESIRERKGELMASPNLETDITEISQTEDIDQDKKK